MTAALDDAAELLEVLSPRGSLSAEQGARVDSHIEVKRSSTHPVHPESKLIGPVKLIEAEWKTAFGERMVEGVTEVVALVVYGACSLPAAPARMTCENLTLAERWHARDERAGGEGTVGVIANARPISPSIHAWGYTSIGLHSFGYTNGYRTTAV